MGIQIDRKSTRLNSSHANISYAVYDIRKGGQPKAPAIKAGAWGLENSVYKLTLDANGDISGRVSVEFREIR